jgi:hypothetical protein
VEAINSTNKIEYLIGLSSGGLRPSQIRV